MAVKNNKLLVLCIDRDDDIGRKLKVKGPIIGEKENINVAKDMALVDPEDTDINAMFGAVKVAREMECEVVTLTGDMNVGEVSDTKLSAQLDSILGNLKPDSVILVSDGEETEQIMPIVQSRVKISAVKTIVVRQSKELEKAYFTVTNFVKEVSEDPNVARLLFGVPGVALLLLSIYGFQAVYYIVGITGLYLLLKGMGYEEYLFQRIDDFIKSLSVERISTVTYFISIVTLAIGLGFGYSDLARNPFDFSDMGSTLDSLSIFVVNTSALDIVLLAVVIAIMGKIADEIVSKKYLQVRRYFILLVFVILLKFIITAGANFSIKEDFGLGNFLSWVMFGILIFYLWVRFTESMFVSEIKSIKDIINSLSGLEVYTSDGKHIGKVTKVLIVKAELSGIKVGRKTILTDNIVSRDKVVVVKI
ncbi:MAG: DUF373 family protein [Candidatus Altiarchaeota archaeon]